MMLARKSSKQPQMNFKRTSTDVGRPPADTRSKKYRYGLPEKIAGVIYLPRALSSGARSGPGPGPRARAPGHGPD